MRLYEYTVGADPELFIINSKTNKVVSSIGIIPGVKDNPYVGEDMPQGFGLETDNILAEFNIPPCHNITEWVNHIEYMKEYIRHFVQNINPDYDIKCSAYEEVDEDQLQSKEARILGCDQDYNVYTMKPNPKPNAKQNGRSAGFHVHLGYPNHNIETSLLLIKYFDAFLGLTSLLYDKDARRRNLYGKAGAFRLQPWGFEYRSLSSAMMADKKRIEFVFKQLQSALYAFNKQRSIPEYSITTTAINNSDEDLAKKLIDKYHLLDYHEKIPEYLKYEEEELVKNIPEGLPHF
jgi:hypothetical protein